MKEFAIGVAAVVVGMLVYDLALALGVTPSEIMSTPSTDATSTKAAA